VTGNDRAAALRQAERALRQGRLDQAIAEYERLVEDQPRDWSTANALGDLYVRAGRVPDAVTVLTRVADALSRDGFGSRAAAFYKKVLKLDPRDEHALLRTADIAAEQGLLADARLHLRLLEQVHRDRGHEDRAEEVAGRISMLVAPVTRSPVAGAPADAALAAAVKPVVADPEPQPDPEPDPSPAPTAEAIVMAAPVVTGPPIMKAAVTPGAVDEEIDLTGDLEALTASSPVLVDARSLDEAFAQLREEAGRDRPADPAEAEYARAMLLHEAGDLAGCITALEAAAHAPRLRFSAAAWLGRLHRQRGGLTQAVEWLERAAEAPSPSATETRSVLYDLGDALEAAGDAPRALAIFLDLRADAGTYRDVDARVERLIKTGTRG
jgi:tetratricopeptide (TPR) repeat protein